MQNYLKIRIFLVLFFSHLPERMALLMNTLIFAFLHQTITCHLSSSAEQPLQGLPFIPERFQVLDLKQHKENTIQGHRNWKKNVSTETFRGKKKACSSSFIPVSSLRSAVKILWENELHVNIPDDESEKLWARIQQTSVLPGFIWS